MTKQLKDWNNVVFDNTKYFHTKTMIKRHKNRIKELKDENNIWVWKEYGLRNIVVEYYKKLFSRDKNKGRANEDVEWEIS
jgi:hypothetical protein